MSREWHGHLPLDETSLASGAQWASPRGGGWDTTHDLTTWGRTGGDGGAGSCERTGETLSCFITAWIILVCGLQHPHTQHTFTEVVLCAGQLLDTRHRREWSRWVSILKEQTAQISPQAEGFWQGCTWSSTISAGIVSPKLLALHTGVILTQVAVPLWEQDDHPFTGWGHVSSAPKRNLTSLSL